MPPEGVRLSEFSNEWYKPGRSRAARLLWLLISAVFFDTWVPWPSYLKAAVLRLFGAKIGKGVVLKPHVRIKYPWRLSIGDDCWIGEGVWIDNLAQVSLGNDVCLSQRCMIETGNHDWSDPRFGLIVRGVVIADGAWAAVGSLLLPGSRLEAQAVLGAESVLTHVAEPSGIYLGNPAQKVRMRHLSWPGPDGQRQNRF